MQKYLECVQRLKSEFSQIIFEKVPREENTIAEMLSKLSAGEHMEGP